jgi:hypothetical protein
MIKIWALIAISLHFPHSASSFTNTRVSESYHAYRIAFEPQQIYSSYLLHFEGNVAERSEAINKETNVIKEQVIPAEFMRYMDELSDISDFVVELGFGNCNALAGIPQIEHNLPNAGMTLRVKTASSEAYLKLVKLLSGFFNTEIERPSLQTFRLSNFENEEVVYHNSGSNSLNFNMFQKILNFVNYQKTFTMVSLINYMATLESDYVSFILHFNRGEQNKLSFHYEINLVFREFILERLFTKTSNLSLKKLEASSFFNPEATDLKQIDQIDATIFKQFIKRSKPIYTLQGRAHAARNVLMAKLHLAKPFIALRNEMVLDFENTDAKSHIEILLNIIFTPAELPIIADISFERFTGNFQITSQSLTKFYEKTNHAPGHVLTFRGIIEVGGKVRLKIPYQQVHRNFETINSEHVINYIIPATTIEYRRAGGPAFTRHFNNIAYKSKNYDTTVVFAIISVYLVILFFMFNSITKIKEDEKAK